MFTETVSNGIVRLTSPKSSCIIMTQEREKNMNDFNARELDLVLNALIAQRKSLSSKISESSSYDERELLLIDIFALDEVIGKIMSNMVESN